MGVKIGKRISAVFLIFVVMFACFSSYYFYAITSQDSKIAQLNAQVQSLKVQIANLTTADLTTALQENEIVTSDYAATKSIPYNYFCVSGTVANTGGGKALYAGLHVDAYSAAGIIEINMTFPLSGGTFGTDSRTDAYVASPQYSSTGSGPSLKLGNLAGGETVEVFIRIFHEGVVTNWTVTPVWTNPQL
jgi:hypothetical protein